MTGKLFLIGGIALAAAALPAPATACRNSCSGSTGGQPVPAPAGIALFALAATLVATRRR